LENTAGNTNPIGNYRMSHGGSTPLLLAARQGDVDTARVLVDAGADVNDTSAAGTNALVVAAHSGHGPLGIYLLEHGADPNADGAGYTALHAAVLRSQVHLASALLDHGADVNAVLQHGTPGRRFSADYSLRHQWIGANVFWLAAKYGELEILRLLAERGADSLSTPDSGMSSLQAAMGITQSTEDRRNRVGTPPPGPGEAEQLAYQLAQITLDLGVDVTTADERGDTALHYAVRQGYGSVIELLADAGADLNATNAREQTPLSLADRAQPFRGGYLEPTGPPVAELLKRLGATDPGRTTGR
jgi:ankyrin repeat protein